MRSKLRRSYNLTAKECDETGELGLALDYRLSNFYEGDFSVPLTGQVVAHDIVEHVNGLGHIGTVFDEFQALGAIWYTRGQFCDLNRNGIGSIYTPHENLAHDIGRMSRFSIWNPLGGHLKRAPTTDADDDFRDILELSKGCIKAEIDAEMLDDEPFDMDGYLTQAFRGMRLGYLAQQRRFPYDIEANQLFWLIEAKVEPLFKRIEYEGQRFRLHVGEKVVIEEVYDYHD